MDIGIVIPTYNEKKNLSILIPKIKESVKADVIIADDYSKDGTKEFIDSLKDSSIHLVLGPKQGLGKAYLRGFEQAKKLNSKIIVMMDADLSHDPKDIPRLIKELKNYDFAIGSRYIIGGRIEGWNKKRILISSFGNKFARKIPILKSINDCTSGFRAFKASYLEKIRKTSLHPRGYAFQLSLLYEMLKAGAKVKEIPIIFKERIFGESKLRFLDLIEFISYVSTKFFKKT